MSIRLVLQIVESSLNDLYANDGRIINIRVKEEAINHRLARYIEHYLAQAHIGGLEVDLEYDRHGNEEKKIRIKQRIVAIRPDIISHQRGHDRRNFLAVEAKKDRISRHDENKIKALLQPPFNYRYGALISYLPGRDHFLFFIAYRYRGEVCFEEYTLEKI